MSSSTRWLLTRVCRYISMDMMDRQTCANQVSLQNKSATRLRLCSAESVSQVDNTRDFRIPIYGLIVTVAVSLGGPETMSRTFPSSSSLGVQAPVMLPGHPFIPFECYGGRPFTYVACLQQLTDSSVIKLQYLLRIIGVLNTITYVKASLISHLTK